MMHPNQSPPKPPFSQESSIGAWELSPWRAAPFNGSDKQKAEDVKAFLSTNPPQMLFRIRQQHSRSPLQITPEVFDVLNSSLNAFPGFKQIISKFVRDSSSDYYLGQSAIYFSPLPRTREASQTYELCCLLKFVERNTRKPAKTQENTIYGEVHRWSLRQQAVYHSYQLCVPGTERTILINPSVDLWISLKDTYQSSAVNLDETQEWSRTLVIMIESLAKNWSASISCLHRAVEQLKRDATATHYDRPDIGEANEKSLQFGLDIVNMLQHTAHALDSNIVTLKAVRGEAENNLLRHSSTNLLPTMHQLSYSVESVIRELEFEKNQVQLIMNRLQTVLENIRDLLNLRSTHSMQQMTTRTILEARTMRIIAFVTLAFLPPTFIAGFLAMGYIHVESSNGALSVSSEPDLLLYFAITIPLVAAIISSYVYWDRRNKYIAKRAATIIV